jgi:DNA-binding Lrp family transcriptional regulator
MGGLSASAQSITIRKKDTRHGGTTPKLGIRVVRPFQAGLMAAFRKSERSGTGKEAGMVGINPTFQPEDVPVIVKRDKSFIFFGREEVVANAHLVFRPLVEVGVAIKTGVLKKRIEMRYLILDGQTGKFVELGDVPVMYEGLQRLMGLNSEEIEILRTTMPDRDMSILEIANKIGVSKEVLRKPIRLLEEKRLIRSFQFGKARVFRRIFGFPNFQWHESEQPLESVEGSKAKVEEYKLDEENVREVVKGLISYSDVQSFNRFVYPLYRVELIMKRKKRVVWLDGQSGKEIHP